jgi:hypothetical protein
MTTIRVRFRQEGMHTKMRVFVGEAGKTFALAGTLAMYPHEADAFFTALQAGANGPIGSNSPVEIGLDEGAHGTT